MTNEELMKRLGAMAREQQQLDCLEALSAGDLSPQQRAELQEQAASSGPAASAYEAYRPVDADFRSRLLERAQAELGMAEAPQSSELERIPPRSEIRRSDAAAAPEPPQRHCRSRRRPA